MKKTITILLNLIIFQIGYSQDSFELKGKWATNTFPNFIYTFDSLDNVRFDWKNDIGSYYRIGKYVKKEDTIKIEFEPLFSFKNLTNRTSDNLKVFVCNIENEKLPYFKVQVIYESGKKLVTETHTNGFLFLQESAKIDSVYLDHGYCNLAPEERNPDIDNPNFYNSFYSLTKTQIKSDSIKIIVDTWLMGYDFKSDTQELLRINDDRIFNGIDYDPNNTYIGGILTKIE